MHRRLSTLAVGVCCLLVLAGPAVAQSGGFTFTATAGDAQPGGTATVTFTFENTGDEPASGIVNVTQLPSDWTVENLSGDGGVTPDDEEKWLYRTVEPGASVAPSVTLSVPANASGSYDVVATATDGDTTSEATATVTVGDGSGGATEQDTTGGNGPGFGVLGAVAALVGATLLVRRRR